MEKQVLFKPIEHFKRKEMIRKIYPHLILSEMLKILHREKVHKNGGKTMKEVKNFINGWYIAFGKDHLKCEKTLKHFAKFYNDRSMLQMTPPGQYMIGGRLGESEVYTPPIVSIERVAYGYPFGNRLGDTFLATTSTGSKYFFNGNDYDPKMIMVVGQWSHKTPEKYCEIKKGHIPVAM